MKNQTILILFFVLTIIFSCNRPERIISPPKAETPKALQEENLLEEVSSFSKRGGDDMIDELYSELVNKKPALKELEVMVSNIRENEVEALDNFETFNNKSNRFYNLAASHINNISDSVFRASLQTLINESELKYKGRSARLTAMIEQIKNNSNTISDYQEALKVILTLPIIEKYQTDYLPQDSLYRRIIGEQQKVIVKLKKVLENSK